MSPEGTPPAGRVDCPFCLEPVRAGARLCCHCRSDLAVSMPLLLAQRAQAERLEALVEQVAELRADLARMAAGGAAAPAATAPSAVPLFGDHRAALWTGVGACFALLVLLHWLMVIRADVAAILFRLVCIVVPFGIAVAVPGLWRNPTPRLLAGAAPLGLLAVLAMSFLVARVDGTPVLPRTARDLYELLEFGLSITLSFLAGPLILKLSEAIRTQRLHHAALRHVRGALAGTDVQALGTKAEAMQKVADLLMPLGAVLGAMFAAFRAFLG